MISLPLLSWCVLPSFIVLLLLHTKGSKADIFPPRTVVTWINGIGHNFEHMSHGQVYISSIFGKQPVEFCHNPTAMVDENDTRGYIDDLTQATTQKLGKITTEVDELVR